MTTSEPNGSPAELRWENEGGHLRTPHGDEGSSQPLDPPAMQGLADVHALLLRQVATRADAVFAALAANRWPQPELDDLVDYVQTELIAETRLKERLLFTRTDTASTDAFARLERDHVNLRYTLEELRTARNAPDGGDPQALAENVRALVTLLTEHLPREATILARHTLRPGWDRAASARQRHPHAWYPLTRGPVIDVDAFTATWAAIEAITARVQRLRPGEHVELVARVEPQPLCRLLLRDREVSVRYLSSDTPGWRVRVTRRRPD